MPGSNRPPVYAIVVNYNGWRDTVECLESLLRSDYPALRVIVCDNASDDDSVDRIAGWARGAVPAPVESEALASLTFPPLAKPVSCNVITAGDLASRAAEAGAEAGGTLLLVRCPSNLGFAGANNVALSYVRSCELQAYAVLINNDTVIAPTAISEMVRFADGKAGVGAVGATVLQYRNPDCIETLGGGTIARATGMARWVKANVDRRLPRPESPALDYVTGCCLLVSTDTMRRVGLMAEEYFLYGEDADWCLRMRRAGRHVAYCPAAEIWHKGGATVVHRSAIHDYYAVRNTLMLMQRFYPASLPLVFANVVTRFLLPKVVRGEWRRFSAAVRGCRDFLFSPERGPHAQAA